MRVALFLGSFNPLTNAHVALANGALEEGCVDQVWFVLSPANPSKVNKGILAPEEDRLNMVKEFLVNNGDNRMVACDVEFSLPRPSYTHRTLSVLKKEHPRYQFFILCGADVLMKVSKWKSAPEIIEMVDFICQVRHSYESQFAKWFEQNPDFLNKTTMLKPMDSEHDMQLSSTLIRNMVKSGESLNGKVPPLIEAYIKKHKLYTK